MKTITDIEKQEKTADDLLNVINFSQDLVSKGIRQGPAVIAASIGDGYTEDELADLMGKSREYVDGALNQVYSHLGIDWTGLCSMFNNFVSEKK